MVSHEAMDLKLWVSYVVQNACFTYEVVVKNIGTQVLPKIRKHTKRLPEYKLQK